MCWRTAVEQKARWSEHPLGTSCCGILTQQICSHKDASCLNKFRYITCDFLCNDVPGRREHWSNLAPSRIRQSSSWKTARRRSIHSTLHDCEISQGIFDDFCSILWICTRYIMIYYIDVIQKGHSFSHIFTSGCVALSCAGTVLGEHMFLGLRHFSQARWVPWNDPSWMGLFGGLNWIHPINLNI